MEKKEFAELVVSITAHSDKIMLNEKEITKHGKVYLALHFDSDS